MDNPIKTALSSYGFSGKVFHAPFLKPNKGFQIIKVLERSKTESEGKIPGSVMVRNYEDIINDPEIELVVVNTPNHFHYQMTKLALEKGKHVIVEKPFTTTVSEAEELIGLAKKKGLVLAVFQNRRFDIDFRTVQKVLNSGILGNIKLFESKMYKWRPDLGTKIWKIEPNPASGLFYDLGPHLIDQALVLFGKPKSIFTDLAAYRKECNVDDYFETIFDYGDKKVHLKGFYLSAISEPRYTIYGDLASYQKIGHDIQEPILISGTLPGTPEWSGIYKNQEGKIYRNNEIIEVIPEQTDYREYFGNIYDAIRKGAELFIKPEAAMEVIGLIELGFRSFNEKKVLEL